MTSFQEAILKIEERGDFNRFVELKAVFEDRLHKLKKSDHLERGLCYYYLLVSYLKAHLVHETEESIHFYEQMDKAFHEHQRCMKSDEIPVTWGEEADFYRLMNRCYSSLVSLYNQHDFKTRQLEAHCRKMEFHKKEALFHRHYLRYFELCFMDVTSHYGTSLLRWALTTFVFLLVTSMVHAGLDQMTLPELRLVGEHGHFFDYFYFSVVTTTTVGFGDITPLTLAAKALTVFQAFTGFVMLGILLNLIQKKL